MSPVYTPTTLQVGQRVTISNPNGDGFMSATVVEVLPSACAGFDCFGDAVRLECNGQLIGPLPASVIEGANR